MEEYLKEAPIASKGWTMKSIEKFEKTIGKKADEHGFFDACVSRMEDKMGEQAKGFCAAVKDFKYGSPNWRGKGKSKEQVNKDTKKDKFKKQIKELKDRNGNILKDGDWVMYGKKKGQIKECDEGYKIYIDDENEFNNINKGILLRIK